MVANIDSQQNKISNQTSVTKSVEPGQIEGYVDDKAEFESDNSSVNEDSKLQDVLIEVLKMASNDVPQVSTYNERKENVLNDVINKRVSSNESLYETVTTAGNEEENLIEKDIMDTRQRTT